MTDIRLHMLTTIHSETTLVPYYKNYYNLRDLTGNKDIAAAYYF